LFAFRAVNAISHLGDKQFIHRGGPAKQSHSSRIALCVANTEYNAVHTNEEAAALSIFTKQKINFRFLQDEVIVVADTHGQYSKDVIDCLQPLVPMLHYCIPNHRVLVDIAKDMCIDFHFSNGM